MIWTDFTPLPGMRNGRRGRPGPDTLSVDIPNQVGEEKRINGILRHICHASLWDLCGCGAAAKVCQLEDFKNRHYETDKPKEIELPAVYSDEAGAQASPGMLDSFYCYKASDTAAELEKRYQIRFLEESHVIQAHSDRGDFEIYKYGMETDGSGMERWSVRGQEIIFP